jgi:hypothetical protein
VDALAEKLKDMLRSNDVILEIGDIHRFEGSLPAFVNQFWNPIISVLVADPLPGRLIVLLTMEPSAPPELKPFLHDLAIDKPQDFAPTHLIKLPELDAFTENEIAAWLRDWFRKDVARTADMKKLTEDAQKLAKTLFDETKGEPLKLQNKLRDPSTWL